MKKTILISLGLILALAWVGLAYNVYFKHTTKSGTIYLDVRWLCPVCSKGAEECHCTDEDYKNWRAMHNDNNTKVFCGVLVCPEKTPGKSEWIDPIGEESITNGDGDGWYTPNLDVEHRLSEYLKMAEAENIIYVYVGIYDWCPILKDNITKKFFEKVVGE